MATSLLWDILSTVTTSNDKLVKLDATESLFNYYHSSCLELLVTGYVSSNHRLFVPSDIAYLIANYFKNYDKFIDISSYLLCTGNKSSKVYNSTNILFNIATNKSYHCKIKDISSSSTISIEKNQYPVSDINGKCIIKSSCLPNTSFNQLLSINNNNKLKNKHFTMIINIGNDECNLTAFHSSSFLNTSKSSYITALRFKLPPIPAILNKNPSVIYSTINQKLYVITPKNAEKRSFLYNNQSIFSLDFKYRNTNRNKWKWIEETDNLKYIRWKTSSCFVDNDKYIMIMGGIGIQEMDRKTFDSKTVQLYDIKTKIWIPLKKLNRDRINAPSLFNDKLYKIMIAGSNGIFDGVEIYDINKDIWLCPDLLSTKTFHNNGIISNNSQNLYVSPLNPNILFFSGINNSYKHLRPILNRIDLRNNSIMTVSIPHVWFSDNNCFLSNLSF